jgi:predicted O-methyltransferase YrrM
MPGSRSAATFARRFRRALYARGIRPLEKGWRRILARREKDRIHGFNDFFLRELGVSRSDVSALHERICAACGMVVRREESRHRFFFAALKVSGFAPSTILEIGTEYGETTIYLSELFPEARITTIDLPKDDPIYADWHPEGAEHQRRKLAERLQRPNVSSLQVNTVWLQGQDFPRFDLIWLDGGHEYPEVAWDHFYCVDKLAAGGWLFSDDVFLPGSHGSRRDPGKSHPYAVISYFNARLENEFRLLLKREALVEPLADAKYIAAWHRT